MMKLLVYLGIALLAVMLVLEIMGLRFDPDGATNFYPYLVQK